MSDLLDLRSAPRPSRRPRRRSGLVGVAVVLVVLLLVGAGLVAAVRAVFDGPDVADYEGAGTGSVVVQVEPGQTLAAVGRTLEDKDVVASAAAFRRAATAEPRATSLQPGSYRLRQRMSASAALALLLDPASRLRGRIVVPEGLTVQQTLARIADTTDIPLARLQAAAGAPDELGLPSYAKGLEGFLFPATYDVEPGTDAVGVLRAMVARFSVAADAVGLEAGARRLGLTPYEAVVVASLIEREVRLEDELPKVARVVYNRLDQGMPLQIDAAVLYGLGRTSGGLTQSDLRKDTPYNLRENRGLPPTPIASPGEATLRAALQPAPGDWLYYVLADKNGRTLFTADYQEFLRQKATSQREGVF